MAELRKACAECPFSRKCPVGGTGGSDPEVYVGQAWGPFLLACHMDPDYDPKNPGMHQPQCAGAAIFRENVDRGKLMPDAMLHLPKDETTVFATPAELIAHHRQISIEEAESILEKTPPIDLLDIELHKREVKLLAITRKNS